MLRSRPDKKLVPVKTITCSAGSEELTFSLERDCHKTVRLRVRPDGTAWVRAPLRCSETDIKGWVLGRADWIRSRQAHFRKLRAEKPLPGYESGSVQCYLGRDYTLHVVGHVRGSVELAAREIRVNTRGEPTPDKVRKLLTTWFQARAGEIFAQRLEHWLPGVRAHGIGITPVLRIRAMKSRYGSCSSRGVIALSRYLTAVPLECIDYVLVHELCHLKHFAHDPPFYNLLAQLLPDWRERKATLHQHWQALF